MLYLPLERFSSTDVDDDGDDDDDHDNDDGGDGIDEDTYGNDEDIFFCFEDSIAEGLGVFALHMTWAYFISVTLSLHWS